MRMDEYIAGEHRRKRENFNYIFTLLTFLEGVPLLGSRSYFFPGGQREREREGKSEDSV